MTLRATAAVRWLAAVLVLLPVFAEAQPVGTAFSYQGRLTEGTGPANGGYDLLFVLFDAPAGGTQVGPVQTRDDILVTNGLFTVVLDFGPAFGGAKRFLDIGVRPGASTGAYTPLVPRQEVTPTPNALAAEAAQAAPWTGVTGKPAGFADDVDNDSGGDITGITAGTGLTGGGTAGTVSLGVSFAGSGIAATVPRSDHDHFAQDWSGARDNTAGFSVRNTSPSGGGLQGTATGAGVGVRGTSQGPDFGTGVAAQTIGTSSVAVSAVNLAASGFARGVDVESRSPSGVGVFARNLATTGAASA